MTLATPSGFSKMSLDQNLITRNPCADENHGNPAPHRLAFSAMLRRPSASILKRDPNHRIGAKLM
jgi:hypothetical protein